MRVPFPLSLNIGTDIIAHRRLIKPHTTAEHLRRLVLRFLHPLEVCELNKRFPDWQNIKDISSAQQTKICAHLAGRWAAKEAAKKAWGATLIGFKDLRIETLPDGNVKMICQAFHDKEFDPGHRTLKSVGYEQEAKMSISHDGDYAVATVIASPLQKEIVAELQARKEEAIAKVMGVQ